MNPLEQLPIPLLSWYGEHARTLPWRSDPTPYHVWVSEIMLQQTRVAAVLGYYARFMAALPTVEALAQVEEDVLLKLWQGLGYYNRARNLQKAARQIVEEFSGVFPATYEDLLTLAGVGEYTAGAVASIAFGVSVPAVDGNVLRVVSRITGDGGDITRPETKTRMRSALLQIIPKKTPGDFNQAMMELGATVCVPNGPPSCEKCPAKGFCTAFLQEKTAELPVKTKKAPRRTEERQVFLIFTQNGEKRVALRRRPEKGLLAGLWEYPNELKTVENPLEAWGITPVSVEYGGGGKHIFTHIEWHMTAYIVFVKENNLPSNWVWADRSALRQDYAVPNAFQSFTHLVDERL